ncbi:hypothetical protein [Dietzia sp.]|uniref:hypothetical protein n=1 Tax=Dietzia sp. TaxID=1871616 RepID=UPI002FD9DA49
MSGGVGPESGDGIERRRRGELEDAPFARAAGRAVGRVLRELRNAPARGWLLAERLGAVAARANESRAAVADVLGALWELAENSEATVRHVASGPLGQERTEYTISPATIRNRGGSQGAGGAGQRDPGTHYAPGEPHVHATREESKVVLQTGGLLSSDEAVLVEVEIPESRLELLLSRLEAAGVATAGLRDQLRGLPSHALPLRDPRRR